jgi:hypothetical protein
MLLISVGENREKIDRYTWVGENQYRYKKKRKKIDKLNGWADVYCLTQQTA